MVVQIVQSASHIYVEAAFSRLGPVNSYTDLLNASTDPAHILAADQIIHMTESWRYLSSALFAYLNHETPNSTHFAYYAQLRAALSLFSGSGIRVKHDNSYWLNATGRKTPIPRRYGDRTHKFAALAWSEWIKRDNAKAILANEIYIQPSIRLRDFEPALKQFSYDYILAGFGHDFINLKSDHLARNVASYEPYWSDRQLTRMSNKNVAFAKELSKLFLTDGNSFIFDRALIQYLVHYTTSEISQDTADQDKIPTQREKDQLRMTMCEKIADLISVNPKSLYEVLSENVGEKVFTYALCDKEPASVESIISRAAFLVRYAMLAVKKNITLSGNVHIKKWIQNWLERCGCWLPTMGVELEDLEADYADAIHEFPNHLTHLPSQLWEAETIHKTFKLANPHLCLAWGIAA